MRTRWRVTGVVAAVGVGLLAGCAGPAPGPDASDAEIADAADCAVREAFAAFGAGDGEDLPAAPRAGAVPDGFDPVAAVECRMAEAVLLPAPEVAVPVLPDEAASGELQPGETLPGGTLPGEPLPGETLPGEPMPGGTLPGEPLPGGTLPGGTLPGEPLQAPATPAPGMSVDAVRLEGDLGPLLDELARPDVPERPDQACMAMFEVVPLLYLVDADDRAVRVRWPTDACGFLLDGAHAAVDALTEVGRTTTRLPGS